MCARSREIFIFDVKSSVKLTKAKRDFSRHMMPSSLLRSRPIKKMLQISGGLKNKRSIAPMIDIFACQKSRSLTDTFNKLWKFRFLGPRRVL